METVSEKIMKNNEYKKEIFNALEATENYEMKITKEKNRWKISLEKRNIPFISVYSKTKTECFNILVSWIKYIYPFMLHQPFETVIREGEKSLHAVIQRNGKALDFVGSSKEEFWGNLKKLSIKSILYREPINLMFSSDDLTALNALALEYFLLENYCVTAKKENQKVASTLYSLNTVNEEKTTINIDVISENKFPNLRKYLMNPNIRCYIKKEESLMICAVLMNIDTGSIIASSKNHHVIDLLEELEFNIQNNKSRIRKEEKN